MRSLKVGVDVQCLTSDQLRGLVRYTTCLLKALSEREDVQLLLYCNSPLAPKREFLQGIRWSELRQEYCKERTWGFWRLPRLLIKDAVDVFHAPADRGLPWRRVCPQVVTVHDSYERAHWRALHTVVRDRAHYWLNEYLNRFAADRVLTVSETTARDLIRLGVVPPKKLRVVKLAAAPEFTSEPGADDVAIRQKYQLPEEYWLYVGGFDVRKNVRWLVERFLDWPGRPRDLVVVAVPRYEYPSIRKLVDVAGQGRVHLVPASGEHLPAIYRSAYAFINPSLWESFSFQLVEAMASGVPVLASSAKAIPEILGEAGWYFQPSDPRTLYAALEKATDPHWRQTARRAGLARAREFSWEHTADATMSVYREVVSCHLA